MVQRLNLEANDVTFLPVPFQSTQMFLNVISDAAMAPANEEKGRSGYLIFRRQGDVTHAIHWRFRKLRRVARSSTTAEILSTA